MKAKERSCHQYQMVQNKEDKHEMCQGVGYLMVVGDLSKNIPWVTVSTGALGGRIEWTED